MSRGFEGNVYVSNLNPDTNTITLWELFADVGEGQGIIAFIQMRHAEDVGRAIAKLDKKAKTSPSNSPNEYLQVVEGRSIRVEAARPRRQRRPPPAVNRPPPLSSDSPPLLAIAPEHHEMQPLPRGGGHSRGRGIPMRRQPQAPRRPLGGKQAPAIPTQPGKRQSTTEKSPLLPLHAPPPPPADVSVPSAPPSPDERVSKLTQLSEQKPAASHPSPVVSQPTTMAPPIISSRSISSPQPSQPDTTTEVSNNVTQLQVQQQEPFPHFDASSFPPMAFQPTTEYPVPPWLSCLPQFPSGAAFTVIPPVQFPDPGSIQVVPQSWPISVGGYLPSGAPPNMYYPIAVPGGWMLVPLTASTVEPPTLAPPQSGRTPSPPTRPVGSTASPAFVPGAIKMAAAARATPLTPPPVQNVFTTQFQPPTNTGTSTASLKAAAPSSSEPSSARQLSLAGRPDEAATPSLTGGQALPSSVVHVGRASNECFQGWA